MRQRYSNWAIALLCLALVVIIMAACGDDGTDPHTVQPNPYGGWNSITDPTNGKEFHCYEIHESLWCYAI